MSTLQSPGQPSGQHPEDETGRLRRHLRALSAVNRQLHAQLEGGPRRAPDAGRGSDDLLGGANGGDNRLSRLAIRRAESGSEWIEQLQLRGTVSDPYLVRSPKLGAFLVEGPLRRQVKAGMLFVALEGLIGAARVLRDTELERLSEGPPVEVLESGSGAAFIVVAGRRLPLRGLPLPYPVTVEEMLSFPEGEELRVGAGGGNAGSGSGSVRRVGSVLRREGPAKAAAVLAKRAVRRLGRSARGAVEPKER
jgi:hypothetical protein